MRIPAKPNRLPCSIFLLVLSLTALPACSPRDFLTRRLAADLISNSDAFRSAQLYWLRTGIVSNKDFSSPESLVLQRHGWIIGTEQKCPPGIDPPPCFDALLTPLGVEIVSPLLNHAPPANGPMAIQAARRELLEISGITKSGNQADVEFLWRWISINQIGAALYDTGVRYRSTVAFRGYDDGWRVVEFPSPNNQPLDEALRSAQPMSP